jgi:hypothetical protein
MTRSRRVKPTPAERHRIERIIDREPPGTGLIIIRGPDETLLYRRPGGRHDTDGTPLDACKLIWGLDGHAPRDS